MGRSDPDDGYCGNECRNTLHRRVKGRDLLGWGYSKDTRPEVWVSFLAPRLDAALYVCISCVEEYRYGP